MFSRIQQARSRKEDQENRFGSIPMRNAPVFAGSRIISLPRPDGQWAHLVVDARSLPQRVMSDLLIRQLGAGWLEKQVTAGPLSPDKGHPLMQWYLAGKDWLARCEENLAQEPPPLSGPAQAWFLLAYDVWVLAQYRMLYPWAEPKSARGMLHPIIARIKIAKEFQGARYELTSYALFLRGGFLARPLEQTTGKQGLRVEFLARQRQTGEQVAVEAKGRQRPGVLGFTTRGYTKEVDPEPKIRARLQDALAKRPGMPYVVCMEVNLPPASDRAEGDRKLASARREVDELMREFTMNDEKPPVNLIVLTNYPDHYGRSDAPAPAGYQDIIDVPNPEFPFRSGDTTERVSKALGMYGNMPFSWEEFELLPAGPKHPIS
jgi:hypothetical protein